jgi:hypothetical protein
VNEVREPPSRVGSILSGRRLTPPRATLARAAGSALDPNADQHTSRYERNRRRQSLDGVPRARHRFALRRKQPVCDRVRPNESLMRLRARTPSDRTTMGTLSAPGPSFYPPTAASPISSASSCAIPDHGVRLLAWRLVSSRTRGSSRLSLVSVAWHALRGFLYEVPGALHGYYWNLRSPVRFLLPPPSRDTRSQAGWR